MMIIMLVTYAGDEQTPFNRDRWVNMHFPIVAESWGVMGGHRRPLLPKGDGAWFISIGAVNFVDEAANEAAHTWPETAPVMADFEIVNANQPQRSILKPLWAAH